jgi:hypothetical protein
MDFVIDKVLNDNLSRDQLIKLLNCCYVDPYIFFKNKILYDLTVIINTKTCPHNLSFTYNLHKKIISKRSLFFEKFEFDNNNNIDFDCNREDLDIVIMYLYNGDTSLILNHDMWKYYGICKFFLIDIEKDILKKLYNICLKKIYDYYITKLKIYSRNTMTFTNKDYMYSLFRGELQERNWCYSLTNRLITEKSDDYYFIVKNFVDKFNFSILDDFLNYIVKNNEFNNMNDNVLNSIELLKTIHFMNGKYFWMNGKIIDGQIIWLKEECKAIKIEDIEIIISNFRNILNYLKNLQINLEDTYLNITTKEIHDLISDDLDSHFNVKLKEVMSLED